MTRLHYLTVLATTFMLPAGYATELGKSPSADLGFYDGQSIEDCMAMWDPVTHMTKAQWRTTCDRIRADRLPYWKDEHAD